MSVFDAAVLALVLRVLCSTMTSLVVFASALELRLVHGSGCDRSSGYLLRALGLLSTSALLRDLVRVLG